MRLLSFRSPALFCIRAKISVTSPIVINMPTRELLVGQTNNSFVQRIEHLND